MKHNMMFKDYPEFAEQSGSSVESLNNLQRGLLVGLGAVLAYVAIAISSPLPFFDSFASIFLWIMLLLGPAVAGLVVLKFPSWQYLSLVLRKNVILQAFGLSFLTMSTMILFNIHWEASEQGIVTSLFLTGSYSVFLLWLLFRIEKQAKREKEELFP